MHYRVLGKTGISISELGLGCSRLGKSFFLDNRKASARILEEAFEKGINFFDTARNYGYGTSEEAIGRAFRHNRSKVIIASKGGYLPSTLGRYGRLLTPFIMPFRRLIQPLRKPLKGKTQKVGDYSPAYIKRALEESLKSLQTDYIDIYQLHSPPPSVIESGEIFETLEAFQKEGKIRFYGISVKNLEDAVSCIKIGRVATVQVPFNLLEREAAKEVFPLAKEKGVGVIVRVPFGRGLLTKDEKVKTGVKEGNKALRKEAEEEKQRLSSLLHLDQTNWSDVALQFILAHQEVSTVIAGTISPLHLKENIAVIKENKMSQRERDLIHSL